MTYEVPHLRVPLVVAGGRFATVEQDSVDEVAQCAEAVVRTPMGRRDLEPEFGIPDQAFDVDLPAISDQLSEWEPRALAKLDQEDLEDLVTRIQLDVDLKGTN